MPAIDIHGLTKRYGELTVLRAVSLRIADGGRLALLGPSGAGKTTLLRALAGLEPLDAGRIEIDGVDIAPLSPARRGVALMSQDYALYPQLSVRANLETALLSLRLGRGAVADRCHAALKWFRIQDLANHLPSQLSGGQAQRVALAKALIRQPRWLLLDEPFSQLDGPLREELRELVSAVVQHYQTSLIFVTHDPLDALRLATQVAILCDGNIVQADTPTAVYQSPSNRTVAELMSPWGVNWLHRSSLDQCLTSPLVDELKGVLQSGTSIGFRPEAASIANTHRTHGDDLQIPVIIDHSAYLGFAHLLHVTVVGERYRCLVPAPLATGQPQWLVVPASGLLRIGAGSAGE